jgi:plastocyanin
MLIVRILKNWEAQMTASSRLFVRSIGALTVVVAGLACLVASGGPASAEKRFFTVLAVEPKGGVTVDKEAFPTDPLPSGGGYVTARPDDKTGRWEVSAYIWQPSQIIVSEGDEVTLEFVGINGAAHPTSISAFGQTFTVKRGQAHRVTFTADKVGIFGIICSTHKPSMSGELVVMAKR